MTILDTNLEVSHLRAEEERILANFTRRLIEIASVAGAPGSGTSPTATRCAFPLWRLISAALLSMCAFGPSTGRRISRGRTCVLF
jgi:hypothetical protein